MSMSGSAVLAIVSLRRDILLLRRSNTAPNYPNMWCFPGGRSEEDETPKETAIRELREETGIVVSPDEVYGPVATIPEHDLEVFVAFSSHLPHPNLSYEHDAFLFVSEAEGLPESTGPITTHIFNHLRALLYGTQEPSL